MIYLRLNKKCNYLSLLLDMKLFGSNVPHKTHFCYYIIYGQPFLLTLLISLMWVIIIDQITRQIL